MLNLTVVAAALLMPAAPSGASPSADSMVGAMNAFSFRLLRESAAPGLNAFISPFSVWTALSMTAGGAAGETERAMGQALGVREGRLPDLHRTNRDLLAAVRAADSGAKFAVANGIWANRGLETQPEFVVRSREHYRSEVRTLDFASPKAPAAINDWVSRATNGRIGGIFHDQIPPGAVMYLVNAIHFEGKWRVPFEKSATADTKFFREDGKHVTVPMMRRTGSYATAEMNGISAIQMPYGDGRFRMVAVLPPKNKPIRTFVQEFDAAAWKALLGRATPGEVLLTLPRLQMATESKLKGPLTKMGMGVAFGGSADFTKISRTGSLRINDVLHKTFLRVDEAGTEAAAVTAVEMRSPSIPPPPKPFALNRPFLFAIDDTKTGAILFIGIVVQPRERG
jgi:serine protease inhibitor